jgi:regulator of protease activity HflC (stomatin/prohibitin superfamily)
MAESKSDVTDADIAVAVNEIERLERTYRGVQGAKALINLLTNRKQVTAELDRRIAEKRAALAALEKNTGEQFRAQGEGDAKRIVAEAEATAQRIIARARQTADEVSVMVTTKRAELAVINDQLDAVRKQAAALAG